MTPHELDLCVDDAVKGRNNRLFAACLRVARAQKFIHDPTLTGKAMCRRAIALMTPEQKQALGLA